MIKISNLRLNPTADISDIKQAVTTRLGIGESDVESLIILRSSIDARRGREMRLVCSVLVETEKEKKILSKNRDKDIKFEEKKVYLQPEKLRASTARPVVVGLGPAGLFAAIFLARAGVPCTVLERGGDIESRALAVENYWNTGVLDKNSNVQFGEGGAGAFSDGKLTTGTHDGRISAVLEALHEFGAPDDILYSHKPHIGTDVLRDVVKNMREELIRLGCDVRFFHCVTDIKQKNGTLTALTVKSPEGEYEIETDTTIFAIGHSARDSFRMLHGHEIEMEAKPFAVGVRIEHLQDDIGRSQYGEIYKELPPTDYKLAVHLDSGRSVFTFCVCPGGVVVASASEDGEIVTNGMSYRARDGKNINGALLCGVNPSDFEGDDPLSGVRFQEKWEKIAFELGNGNAPCQKVGDFLSGKPSEKAGEIIPTYKPTVFWTDISKCLPTYVAESLREALPLLARKVKGFDNPEATLTAIETRSSSPVRITRNEDGNSVSLKGLYPCGEGAGYAGGIVSAAVDGIRMAEAVITSP